MIQKTADLLQRLRAAPCSDDPTSPSSSTATATARTAPPMYVNMPAYSSPDLQHILDLVSVIAETHGTAASNQMLENVLNQLCKNDDRRQCVQQALQDGWVCQQMPRSRFSTVYINLPTRPDRRESIERELATAGLMHEAMKLDARTGDQVATSLVTEIWDSTINAQYDRKTLPHKQLVMSKGERGCAGSHLVLWSKIASFDDTERPWLVLEDDAVLSEGFRLRCDAIIDAVERSFHPANRNVLVYLSTDVAAWREDDQALTIPVHLKQPYPVKLREAAYLWQTAAYIIWPAAARELVAHLPISAPVDVFMAELVLAKRLRAFVPNPQIAKQAVPFANGDILHTNVFAPHVRVDQKLREQLEANQRLIDPTASCGGFTESFSNKRAAERAAERSTAHVQTPKQKIARRKQIRAHNLEQHLLFQNQQQHAQLRPRLVQHQQAA